MTAALVIGAVLGIASWALSKRVERVAARSAAVDAAVRRHPAGKGSASQAPGSPGRCGANAGALTCALPRHRGDRHTSPDGAYWYGAGGRRG